VEDPLHAVHVEQFESQGARAGSIQARGAVALGQAEQLLGLAPAGRPGSATRPTCGRRSSPSPGHGSRAAVRRPSAHDRARRPERCGRCRRGDRAPRTGRRRATRRSASSVSGLALAVGGSHAGDGEARGLPERGCVSDRGSRGLSGVASCRLLVD
jgi:hypothetical protein